MGSTTKSDMDRIGLFKEMEYVTIKDPYKEAARCEFDPFYRDLILFVFCVSLKSILMKQLIRKNR